MGLFGNDAVLPKKTTPDFSGVAKVQGGDVQKGHRQNGIEGGDNSVLIRKMDIQ